MIIVASSPPLLIGAVSLVGDEFSLPTGKSPWCATVGARPGSNNASTRERRVGFRPDRSRRGSGRCCPRPDIAVMPAPRADADSAPRRRITRRTARRSDQADHAASWPKTARSGMPAVSTRGSRQYNTAFASARRRTTRPDRRSAAFHPRRPLVSPLFSAKSRAPAPSSSRDVSLATGLRGGTNGAHPPRSSQEANPWPKSPSPPRRRARSSLEASWPLPRPRPAGKGAGNRAPLRSRVTQGHARPGRRFRTGGLGLACPDLFSAPAARGADHHQTRRRWQQAFGFFKGVDFALGVEDRVLTLDARAPASGPAAARSAMSALLPGRQRSYQMRASPRRRLGSATNSSASRTSLPWPGHIKEAAASAHRGEVPFLPSAGVSQIQRTGPRGQPL